MEKGLQEANNDVYLLEVKMGSFHRALRQAFLGPRHERLRCGGKIYWDEKNKKDLLGWKWKVAPRDHLCLSR